MYTLSVFRELREQYPQWSVLKDFLESPAGGKLRIINCEQEGIHIIRYDKNTTDFSKSHVPWFRSVVWNGLTNLPLCVAPPKANQGLPGDTTDPASLRWESFLEGVMINTYQSLTDTAPQLATRSKLGASGVYYSKRSFSELLDDALAVQDITLSSVLGERQMPDMDSGEVSVFASLLLEHPEHRIVSKVTVPRVTRVHTGVVLATGDVRIEETLECNCIPELHSTSERPALTTETTGRWMTGEAENRGWQWQGVVIKDGKGGRWRLRSSPYMMVRALRGDTPRRDGRFLGLRQRSMVDTYLFYYPEEHAALRRYEQEVRAVTHYIYQSYVAAHITKAVPFGELPAHWKPHVFSLHGQYLGSLRAQGFFMRKQEVINYVNNLPIPRILHLLRKLREATVSMSSEDIVMATTASATALATATTE